MEWVGTPFVAGNTPNTQYILVTIAILGLQFVWSIEQTYVSLYLIELGLSKSILSLVWIAGPLCGLIVQPLVGVYSDFSTSHYGRRRPFMIWGSLATAFGLFVFGWSREIAERLRFKHINGLLLAIVAVLIIDVAVNVCQACCRALIVDMFNEHKQNRANAWAGRMASVGHLISYFLSSLNLTVLGFDTQLKAACCIYSLVLLITVAISAVSVKERVLVAPLIPQTRPTGSMNNSNGVRSGETPSISSDSFDLSYSPPSATDMLKVRMAEFWRTALNLDPQLRAIFKVQLLAWYSWFTFLFYGATYASEVWRYGEHNHINGSQSTNRLLTYSHRPTDTDELARAGSLALTVFSFSSTLFTFILPKFNVNITSIWIFSFVIYALAMVATGFVVNLNQVLIIFATVGLTWACTIWIPYALTAERIHQLPLTETPSIEREPREEELFLDTESLDDTASIAGRDEKSGIILGIHNSAITLPQFISAFSSFVIFRLVDKKSGSTHDDGGRAIAITLQVGGFTALLSAFYAYKVNNKRQAIQLDENI